MHVGHNSLGEACRLAAHAAEIGADAVGMLAPGFYRPVTLDALVTWCERVAAAAPALPFYYDHMPAMNDCRVRDAQSHVARPRGTDRNACAGAVALGGRGSAADFRGSKWIWKLVKDESMTS